MSSSSSRVHLAHPGEYLPAAASNQAYYTQQSKLSAIDRFDDAFTDKAGGWARWRRTNGGTADSGVTASPPPSESLTCAQCDRRLLLLTQLYIPPQVQPHYDDATPARKSSLLPRTLFVFGCNRGACSMTHVTSGSFRLLRMTHTSEVEAEEEPAADGAATKNDANKSDDNEIAAYGSAVTSNAPSSSSAAAAAIPSSTSSVVAASSSTVTAAPVPTSASVDTDSDDEWGAKATWSSDEDESTKTKTKKGKKKTKDQSSSSGALFGGSDSDGEADDDDDDAALSALLARQSLNASNAAAAKEAKLAREKAKAERKAAAEEARAELRAKALEARRKAEAEEAESTPSSSATAASAAPSPATPAPTPAPACFRPFYLTWSSEPADGTSNNGSGSSMSRELRLLQEYQQRMKEEGEGEEGDMEALELINHALTRIRAGAGTGATSSSISEEEEDDEDEDSEDDAASRARRRDICTQSFLDRLSWAPTQCVRYYGVHSEETLDVLKNGVMYSTSKEREVAMSLMKGQSRSGSQRGATNSSSSSSASLPAELRCERCGSRRRLEAQIMPNLLTEMNVESFDPSDPGMDWTTLDLYTCEKSCHPGSYVVEHVHVQPPL